MATSRRNEQPEEITEEKPKSKKRMLLMVAGVSLFLVVASVGGFLFWKKSHPPLSEDEQAQETVKDTKPRVPPSFMKVDVFTVNLTPDAQGGESRFLQTEIALELSDAKVEEEIKTVMPKLRNDMLIILSSSTAEKVLTLDGKTELSMKLKSKINEVLSAKHQEEGKKKEPDAVSAVLFVSFIVQ